MESEERSDPLDGPKGRLFRGWLPMGLFRSAQTLADFGLRFRAGATGALYRSQRRPWPVIVFENERLVSVLSVGEPTYELERMQGRLRRLFDFPEMTFVGAGLLVQIPGTDRIRFDLNPPIVTGWVEERSERWVQDCEDRRRAILSAEGTW